MNIPDLRQSAFRYLDLKFKSKKTHKHIFDKVLREQRKNRNYKMAIAILLLLHCTTTSKEQKHRVYIVLAHKLSNLPQEAREFGVEMSRNLTEFFNSAQIDLVIKDLFVVSIYKLTKENQRSKLRSETLESFAQLFYLQIGHFFEVGRFGRT